jgi:hypothetical protein
MRTSRLSWPTAVLIAFPASHRMAGTLKNATGAFGRSLAWAWPAAFSIGRGNVSNGRRAWNNKAVCNELGRLSRARAPRIASSPWVVCEKSLSRNVGMYACVFARLAVQQMQVQRGRHGCLRRSACCACELLGRITRFCMHVKADIRCSAGWKLVKLAMALFLLRSVKAVSASGLLWRPVWPRHANSHEDSDWV